MPVFNEGDARTNLWVEVYYNLHRKCLSVRSRDRRVGYGRVLGHVDAIVLSEAQFKVSEAGRQRVLREKRKNVHAVVRGWVNKAWLQRVLEAPDDPTWDPCIMPHISDKLTKVTYNPYKYRTFVDKYTGLSVSKAELVEVRGRDITAYNAR